MKKGKGSTKEMGEPVGFTSEDLPPPTNEAMAHFLLTGQFAKNCDDLPTETIYRAADEIRRT